MLRFWFLFCLPLALNAQPVLLAGPAQASCDGQPITLFAKVLNPPALYTLTWQGQFQNSPYLVLEGGQAGTYQVELLDLTTKLSYHAETRVLVHPGSAELNSDGQLNDDDWLAFYAAWGKDQDLLDPNFNPDQDGIISVLDWFYLCNFERYPVNTPPTIREVPLQRTYKNLQISYDLTVQDIGPRLPTVYVSSPPQNGTAFLLGYRLFYDPNPDFVGVDQFQLRAEDGQYQGDPIYVVVQIDETDSWTTLYADIFGASSLVNASSCKPCHVDDQEGGLSLANYAAALHGGNSGIPGVVPFSPSASRIYQRISNDEMPLPPIPPLTQAEKERIRIWILVGAPEIQ